MTAAAIAALRARLARIMDAFFASEYWVNIFLALGALLMGAALLHPGSTLAHYHAYSWLYGVKDPTLAAPLIGVGVWGLLVRRPLARAAAALATCFVFFTLAIAITLGVYHHVAVNPGIGPSLAPVHYFGWATLAFLLSVRTVRRAKERHRETHPRPL